MSTVQDTFVLVPGHEVLLELTTSRPVSRDVLERSLVPVLGEIMIEVPEGQEELAGAHVGPGGGGGGGGGRGGGGFRGGSRMRGGGFRPGGGGGRRHHRRGRRGFGPGWWWDGGYDTYAVDDCDYYDDEGNCYYDDDLDLSGSDAQRVRLVARPSRVVALRPGHDVQWKAPSELGVSVFSPPRVATSPLRVVPGGHYAMRVLSPLPRRRLARTMKLAGLDLDAIPLKTRASVRVSSLYPSLCEYVLAGTWRRGEADLRPDAPGLLIEDASELAAG